MMKEYNAVVIGAGNGGLSAALAFAQEGLKPLVIEQHNLPGGCASSFVRGRFEFDVSLHSLEYETSFKPVFEGMMQLNEPFSEVSHDLCNVYLENGKPVIEHYRTDEQLPQQIEARHPGCGESFRKLLGL